MAPHYPFWLGGEPGRFPDLLDVRSPYSGSSVGTTWLAGDAEFLEDAVRALSFAVRVQAGVFTANLERALRAFELLDVGGVIINDVPTWRIDHMPYGGVKDSGAGREGPRYTIEEMTELKLLVISRQS